MLTLHDQVDPVPEVIHTVLDDGQTVLVHMTKATYFSLNQTGTRIWQMLTDGLTLAEISGRLTTEFDVSLAKAEQSVLNLARELVEAELLSRLDD